MMKQLSGIDAGFLYMETPTTFGHVAGLALYQRPHPDYDPFEHANLKFSEMTAHAEPLRRRLVQVPLGLDHPYWIDDPDFDLSYHVRQIALPRPGSPQQLGEQVARIIGRAMDRSRPMWEVYVIEGLDDGRWAMLTKLHHATIDGAAGMILLNMLTNRDPESVCTDYGVGWEGEQPPSDRDLLRLTMANLARNPAKNFLTQMRLVRTGADMLGISSVSGAAKQATSLVKKVAKRSSTAPDNEVRVTMPISPAPATPWNKTITAHRRLAMRGTPLENLKRLKDATGGTLNDVVMAICTGALREYLIGHDALPEKPLRAMVPVSIRTGDESDPWTNRVSGIIADLPTNEPDPLQRVAKCREAMLVAKRQFDLVPAETMIEATQMTSPVVAASAMRLASRLKLADLVTLPTNVVISNVPGPREPLYFEGSKLESYIPVSIVTDGMGLNITVHSCLDRLDFGLVACRELVPDLWDLVDLHIAEMGVLFAATGATPVDESAGATERSSKKSRTPRPAGRKTAPAARQRATSNGASRPAASHRVR